MIQRRRNKKLAGQTIPYPLIDRQLYLFDFIFVHTFAVAVDL